VRRLIPSVAVLGVAIASCGGQKSGAAQGDSPATASEAISIEDQVLAIFKADDAQAIADLGGRLEQHRPSLDPSIVAEMYGFLSQDDSSDPGLRMVRPMVFRTVAVIVGPASLGTLESCVSSESEYASLCQNTVEEISAN